MCLVLTREPMRVARLSVLRTAGDWVRIEVKS
jgi:hypothetical protein